ncbi:hypothetical protein T281_08170 [Rhodomicrobium udaipurense JA643]|nr:hypothetical protein T281_08170 [Rhodomicrobium udaipurense JA643]
MSQQASSEENFCITNLIPSIGQTLGDASDACGCAVMQLMHANPDSRRIAARHGRGYILRLIPREGLEHRAFYKRAVTAPISRFRRLIRVQSFNFDADRSSP